MGQYLTEQEYGRGLKLPRLISDGCVLQQGKRTRIWGYSVPGTEVTAKLQSQKRTTAAREDGSWEIFFQNLTAGGPFKMEIRNALGECRTVSDVYVGEVWVCSGQSNMELPVRRVMDRYPEEINRKNQYVRMFKAEERYDFRRPLDNYAVGEWKERTPENILDFSAAACFFGQYLQEERDVPVGLLDISKGGSRIEAWMGREPLEGYKELLEEADKYSGENKIKEFVLRQEKVMSDWVAYVEDTSREDALREEPAREWKDILLPGWLDSAGLSDFSGCVWLRRTFTVPEQMAGQQASLWLGTMVDSDKTYINGVLVGETGYQYPPRKYTVPEGILNSGENEICIRLICNDGRGRVTPGKELCLSAGESRVELSGRWQYQVRCSCEKAPEMDFLCRKATGLYNGMLAPARKYTVRGVLWYQGESNDRRPDDYEDLLSRMILSWRKEWAQESLPFIVIQLPGFSIDLPEENSGWPRIREAQKRAERLPGTAVTVNLDLGEDNDLHPQDKMEIARRAAMAARGMVYKEDVPFRGPVPASWTFEKGTVRIKFDMMDGGLLRTKDGQAPGEFYMAGEDGVFYQAECELQGSQAVVRCKDVAEAAVVRYAWGNAPRRGLLCSRQGLLAAPFEISGCSTPGDFASQNTTWNISR